MNTHVVAISGGKDSTALALRLAEVEPRDYIYFCTPTGDELPEMVSHWERLEAMLGKPFVRLTNGTLFDSIARNRALPNWRMRFCTRELKIRPCLEFLKTLERPVLYVGLRADEEERQGLYSHDVETRFPLREWGWGIGDVQDYLTQRGVTIPRRTDCALCYHQRLGEWKTLLRDHPERYAQGEALEAQYGQTFRSPRRDTKPAALKDLRAVFELQMVGALGAPDDTDEPGPCRVCSL